MPLLALAGCKAEGGAGASGKSGEGQVHVLGLYTSLPILWGETNDIRDLLSGGKRRHWLLELPRAGASLAPLDSLADADRALPLPRGSALLLVQPRPLMPQENVALDDWVRAGGKVLLFADPMLTAPSIYALGDARRPQDVVMLSPILARWGLALEFDESQEAGERLVDLPEGAVAANLPGRFRLAGKSGSADSACSLEAAGFLADCRVGAGRVVAIADAALFEEAADARDAQARRSLIENLLQRVGAEK